MGTQTTDDKLQGLTTYQTTVYKTFPRSLVAFKGLADIGTWPDVLATMAAYDSALQQSCRMDPRT